MHICIQSSLTESQLNAVDISEDDVLEALCQLKKNKSHACGVLCSQNYRPIALASSVSKVLERVILSKYEMYFCSNSLQFGFKLGYSTKLCTGIVVSRYIHNGSAVLGCFLDASKAFDMVDHGVLFRTLRGRGLPLPILRFMLSWYATQQIQVP